mgnify:CR=1 FL=1
MSENSEPGSEADARDSGSGSVGNLELFFDLVYVFAVTQLSHELLHDLTPGARVTGLTYRDRDDDALHQLQHGRPVRHDDQRRAARRATRRAAAGQRARARARTPRPAGRRGQG